ncbi:MAG: acyclic terpene utilization AtuA family protein [Proteobacteria bacterium]|nr:acyclic terpene utilization AtuA family protein [Pseudomonadota bacterium]
MSAVARLRERFAQDGRRPPLKVLAASGQLGYGIPKRAFDAGLAAEPDFIGCDMGSIDPGPAYLGSGKMATSPTVTRRDLRMVLHGAQTTGVPLIIGSAGTAGAAPHLEATLAMVREIAREDGLTFRLASIRADLPPDAVKSAWKMGRLRPLGAISEPDEDAIDGCTHLVGQMGNEAIVRALETEADVIVAGRCCDTAIFGAIPQILGFPMGITMHMAKIIECTSICCEPGGRDAILGILDEQGFVLDSMNPERHATPISVAAHSLYEQADPFTVSEPEGCLHMEDAVYKALDGHRTRVHGARWEPTKRCTIKVEGAGRVGERAVLLAGCADPRVIAGIEAILADVEKTVRDIVPGGYRFYVRVYGLNGVVAWPTPPASPPREVFVLVECIAETAEEARTATGIFKQYLLHHGFPGRISTGGNIAFPFTPPELDAGTAYRFVIYHLMEADDLPDIFPVEVEEL